MRQRESIGCHIIDTHIAAFILVMTCHKSTGKMHKRGHYHHLENYEATKYKTPEPKLWQRGKRCYVTMYDIRRYVCTYARRPKVAIEKERRKRERKKKTKVIADIIQPFNRYMATAKT